MASLLCTCFWNGFWFPWLPQQACRLRLPLWEMAVSSSLEVVQPWSAALQNWLKWLLPKLRNLSWPLGGHKVPSDACAMVSLAAIWLFFSAIWLDSSWLGSFSDLAQWAGWASRSAGTSNHSLGASSGSVGNWCQLASWGHP